MADEILTSEKIIEAAETALRRFGLSKVTVIDVARALGVSHGSIYRHFPSKAALYDAVAERWLAEKSAPLVLIANEDGPAPERLLRWLRQLAASKRRYAKDDPEVFAAYKELAAETREVVKVYLDRLTGQIEHIIADGVARGEFVTDDPHMSARAVFIATIRFHDPAHSVEWFDSDIEAEFDAVWPLIMQGLLPRR